MSRGDASPRGRRGTDEHRGGACGSGARRRHSRNPLEGGASRLSGEGWEELDPPHAARSSEEQARVRARAAFLVPGLLVRHAEPDHPFDAGACGSTSRSTSTQTSARRFVSPDTRSACEQRILGGYVYLEARTRSATKRSSLRGAELFASARRLLTTSTGTSSTGGGGRRCSARNPSSGGAWESRSTAGGARTEAPGHRRRRCRASSHSAAGCLRTGCSRALTCVTESPTSS